jgi:cytochrome c556
VSSNYSLRVLLILAAIAIANMCPSSALSQDALSAFMRAKLGHAEKTLEGLVKEDYDLIIKHSQAISLLCEDELWAVLQTPEYRERSKEFRRSVDAVTDAARKKNLEAATLAYVDVTLKCASCHSYMRKVRSGK